MQKTKDKSVEEKRADIHLNFYIVCIYTRVKFSLT